MSDKIIRVIFHDSSLKHDLEKLGSGTFEERRLAGWIRKAILEMFEVMSMALKFLPNIGPKSIFRNLK